VIFIPSRSIPDAREGYEGHVLPFKAVVVVVVSAVVVVTDPSSAGARPVLGRRR
jgi:hypothetical protein